MAHFCARHWVFVWTVGVAVPAFTLGMKPWEVFGYSEHKAEKALRGE